MSSITTISRGSNDLVRSLANNFVIEGLWDCGTDCICYNRTKCQHSYSRVAIVDYLRRGTQQCPMPGCGQLVSMNALQRNEELEARVRAFQRRGVTATQMGMDVDDDDDEVVG